MPARDRITSADAITRLRSRDASLFSPDPAGRIPVARRLGWTDLAEKAPNRLPQLTELADALLAEGATDLLLLGMGGSSLAPLVMARVIGGAEGRPRLHVLDTTSPVQLGDLLDELDPATTHAILASKSGTTIEPLSLYAIVRRWLEDAGVADAGRRFIVITDPGSPLEMLRDREGLRVTLPAPATVGGRYSALSMFGLAPAAMIGVDLPGLISHAQAMESACAEPLATNPGALLAAWMGDAVEGGRDKLMLAFSERLRPLGLWIEQLVAESLGKQGAGLVPSIEYEPVDEPGYDSDRAVAVLRFEDDTELARWSRRIAMDCPVFELTVSDPLAIGAEFVRWEHAVALTGFLLGVNPFDEPNVTEAKAATEEILATGGVNVPKATADLGGTWVTLGGSMSMPEGGISTRRDVLASAYRGARHHGYISVLAYVPESDDRLGPLQAACAAVSRSVRRATTLELGPRYLHSTGQLHKGGPSNGVYVIVTARDRSDRYIPGRPFGLAALHRAQAEGDLVTLHTRGRRVVRFDLPDSNPETIAAFAADLAEAAR